MYSLCRTNKTILCMKLEIKHGHEHKVKIVISQLTLVRLVQWRVSSKPVLAFPTERVKHIKPTFPMSIQIHCQGFVNMS